LNKYTVLPNSKFLAAKFKADFVLKIAMKLRPLKRWETHAIQGILQIVHMKISSKICTNKTPGGDGRREENSGKYHAGCRTHELMKDAEVGVDEGAYVLVNFPAQGRPGAQAGEQRLQHPHQHRLPSVGIRISMDSSALASASSSNQQLVTASTTSHSA
jgi:hypothetical protein